MNTIFSTALITLLLISVSAYSLEPVKTVAQVDLQKYLGLWYQIAYYPNSFQPKDCPVTTAYYSINNKGKIIVLNKCYKDKDGKVVKKEAKGKAYTVDSTNSKLKVSFFWPFKGDYWIIGLDEKNYTYAIVSDPNRKYLWILARDINMDVNLYNQLLTFLKENQFDTDKLIFTARFK